MTDKKCNHMNCQPDYCFAKDDTEFYEMMRNRAKENMKLFNSINIPKKGAGQRLASRLKSLAEQID